MSDIDIYYKSIRRLYDDEAKQLDAEATARAKPRASEWAQNASIGLVVLCVIPVVPFALLWALVKLSVSVRSVPLAFTPWSFLLFWVLCLGVSALLLAFVSWIDGRLDRDNRDSVAKRKFSLSAEQQSFLFAYEAYEELRTFFVSHIDVHVDECLDALSRLLPDTLLGPRPWQVAVPDIEMWYATPWSARYRASSFEDQVRVARGFLRTFDRSSLLGVDDDTRQTLQAIVEFPSKVRDRLNRREDLPAVLKVLENLVHFMFAFLPEHETHLTKVELESLRADGRDRLARFVAEVGSMTAFKDEESVGDANEERTTKNWRAKIGESGYIGIVGRFAAWFVAVFALTSAAVYLAHFRLSLTPDAMATLVIGTSVAGAATLTAVLPGHHEEHSAQGGNGPTNGST
ncbi:hypothetical protein FDZ71_08930 [bacterium]|nr:MAG: hypothetical protein FDZ71_08930 [bacterium]